MSRQDVIEDFLNDSVQKVSVSLYIWRKRFYQVLPYSAIKKSKQTKPDHFVKWTFKNRVYGIREMTIGLLKKYYPELLLDK